MTKQTKSRHGLLRLAGTLPAVIGLLCAFGFTSRAAVIVAPATAPATGTTEEPADIRTAADAMQKQDKTCTATLSVVDKKTNAPSKERSYRRPAPQKAPSPAKTAGP